MKQLSFFLSALMLIVMTSCNDDKKTGDDPQPSDVVSADVQYVLIDAPDMTTLFDMSVSYKDGAGATQQETVTTLPWNKSIHVDKIPFTASFEVTYTAKQDVTPKDTYKVGFNAGFSYQASDGKKFSNAPVEGMGSLTIAADQVSKYQTEKVGTKSYSQEVTPNE
jgi:hypothetical protein